MITITDMVSVTQWWAQLTEKLALIIDNPLTWKLA